MPPTSANFISHPPAAAELPLDQMRQAADQACALMRVLANRDRLLILCQLAHGEKRVGELEALLHIVQPTLSQQLTVLRAQQLVTTRRQGKHIYYALGSSQALAVIQTMYHVFCTSSSLAAQDASSTHPSHSTGDLV